MIQNDALMIQDDMVLYLRIRQYVAKMMIY